MGTAAISDRLPTLVNLGYKTDVRIGPGWILFAIASYILWIFTAVFAFNGITLPILNLQQTLGLLGTLAFATSTGVSFLVSSLISRQNKHAERDLDRTVTAGGWQRAALDGQIPPSRNGTLYAIASVLTVGIVAISWLYVMIIGEEAHFRFHSVLEPRLLEAFSNQGSRTGSVG